VPVFGFRKRIAYVGFGAEMQASVDNVTDRLCFSKPLQHFGSPFSVDLSLAYQRVSDILFQDGRQKRWRIIATSSRPHRRQLIRAI
jgi:hypothetical protein